MPSGSDSERSWWLASRAARGNAMARRPSSSLAPQARRAACSRPRRPRRLAGLQYTEADVRFVQDMIAHHAQALEMTALVDGRSERDDVHVLAQRIALSQADEIRTMREWLRERGQEDTDGTRTRRTATAPRAMAC
jgi:uncharacterized protein (DUF305 family)